MMEFYSEIIFSHDMLVVLSKTKTFFQIFFQHVQGGILKVWTLSLTLPVIALNFLAKISCAKYHGQGFKDWYQSMAWVV